MSNFYHELREDGFVDEYLGERQNELSKDSRPQIATNIGHVELSERGENDKIIDCTESKEALKTLRDIGYPTFIELFSTGHKIPIQARDRIQKFIYR